MSRIKQRNAPGTTGSVPLFENEKSKQAGQSSKIGRKKLCIKSYEKIFQNFRAEAAHGNHRRVAYQPFVLAAI